MTYCREEEHKYFKQTLSGILVPLPLMVNALLASAISQFEPWHLVFFVFARKLVGKKKKRVTTQISLSFVSVCFNPSEQTCQNEKPYFFMNSSQTSQNTSFNTGCSPPPQRGEKNPHSVQQHLNICVPKHCNFLLLS